MTYLCIFIAHLLFYLYPINDFVLFLSIVLFLNCILCIHMDYLSEMCLFVQNKHTTTYECSLCYFRTAAKQVLRAD